jgi:nucleotide-binding universal stress UspA family protein
MVVAVDGSDNGLEAVRWAAHLAAGSSSRVYLVHARGLLEHLRAPTGSGAAIPEEWARPLALAGIPYDTVVADGPPAQVVLDGARRLEADLIVIGSRGAAHHPGGALGSTSAAVVLSAPCPVTVVPIAGA